MTNTPSSVYTCNQQTKYPGEKTLPDTEETGQRTVQSPPQLSLEHTTCPETQLQFSTGDRANRPPPVPPTTEWPTMGEALSSASISEEHRFLMGTVLQSIQSVDTGLKAAFNGLLTGFQVNNVMLR